MGQLKKNLKKEFGCSSVKEARKKLKRLRQKERELSKKFRQMLVAFEKEWKDVLADLETESPAIDRTIQPVRTTSPGRTPGIGIG
jgi:hypothetical protein